MSGASTPGVGRGKGLLVGALSLAVVGAGAAPEVLARATDPTPQPPGPIVLHGFLLERSGAFTTIDPPGVPQIEIQPGVEPLEFLNINNRGQIVGFYTGADGLTHGFLQETEHRKHTCGARHGRGFTTIDFPGATTTSASGINDEGVIVGTYSTGGLQESHGFVLKDGVLTAFDLPGTTASGLTGINNRGALVGSYIDSAGVIHGFLWEKGALSTIDPPGAGVSFPENINERGQIVGYYSTETTSPVSNVRSFLWEDGRFTEIVVPNALPEATLALGINNRGQIVGAYADSTTGHGFVLHLATGTFTDIDVPGATPDLGTAAGDINDRGQIVGDYGTRDGDGEPVAGPSTKCLTGGHSS